MSSAAEIPGFYYDAEKRKYFKIESQGNPSNPYSRDNLAKRRKAEEQESRLARESRLQAQQLENLPPFQRWTHSAYNVRGYLNSREVGLHKTKDDRESLQAKMMRRKKVWQIRHSTSSLDRLTSFALDENSGDAVLGTYGGLISAMPTNPETTNMWLEERQTAVTRFTSQVTSVSLSLCEEGSTLVCCSLGNDTTSGTIHIGKFNRGEDRTLGLEVHAVMKPRNKQALFCTTISRYTTDLFAVGGENVIFVSGGLNEQLPMLNVRSNCLAVEFLGEHTLSAGSRNGVVKLYDFRGQTDVQSTNQMIKHPSSVTNLRQLEDHLLMVGGLENSLAMYDLRYLKKESHASPSTPVVKYSGHINTVSFHLGFDVAPNGSVLAVAGEDRYVRLWSVNTGQRIHARISENVFDDFVVGLQFSRRHQQDNGLWIAGQELEYWSI